MRQVLVKRKKVKITLKMTMVIWAHQMIKARVRMAHTSLSWDRKFLREMREKEK